MSLNSTLKKKPMSAVATLDLNLSAQHSLQNAKADEKIHAGSGNGANAVSGAELWAARIGFFAGCFTVEAVKPLTSIKGGRHLRKVTGLSPLVRMASRPSGLI